MPEPVVQASLAASPAAVIAALLAQLRAQDDVVTGIGGFGTTLTWQSFDGALELVSLEARLTTDPDQPGVTHLEVRRVDPALLAALRTATPRTPGTRSAGEDRSTG